MFLSTARSKARLRPLASLVTVALAGSGWLTAVRAVALDGSAFSTPIRHVVVIDQENHSFDNLLGRFCVLANRGDIARAPCAGATNGRLASGKLILLRDASDIVAGVRHTVADQVTAINDGQMNGFSRISDCTASYNYQCYTQFSVNHGPCGLNGRQSCIPNVVRLATDFALSDHTFEYRRAPSWGGHLYTLASSLDGFLGDTPISTGQIGPGRGCDSFQDAQWWDGSGFEWVPSCVPDAAGNGPYRSSPVHYLPTILDRLDAAGLTWKIYGGQGYAGRNSLESGYQWSACPSFYECLANHQSQLLPADQVLNDALAGQLPNYSLVTPVPFQSQHNDDSMGVGDSWIGSVLAALMQGPDWGSTAVFLTWDDCGCFYDHMNPLQFHPGWGIRLPMIIVSPYARPGFTDSNPATFASMLAFVEHIYGLPALNPCQGRPRCDDDATAYDYLGSFDFAQTPLPPVRMVHRRIPLADRRWLKAHPHAGDALS